MTESGGEITPRLNGGALYSEDEWRRLLAAMTDLGSVRKAHNLAETYRRYADNEQTQLQAARAKIWAAYRGGEILHGLGRSAGGYAPNAAATVAGASDYRGALTDAGMGERLAQYWQEVFRLGQDLVANAMSNADPEPTLRAVLRASKDADADEARTRNEELAAGTLGPEWLPGPYQTIVIDPPWDWGDEGDQNQLGRARPHYTTMPIDDLKQMPIDDLATADAHLYLWVTNRSLPKAFDLISTWKFRYITCLTWVKPSFGMGNYFRGASEHVLFGVRGSLPLLRHDEPTWFEAPRGKEHSGKPTALYELVERCSPGPWLEMFARQTRPGWVPWGAEA